MSKKILVLISALCLIFALNLRSFADFGEFAGDTDYGSSGGSSDSGYDYGGNNDSSYDDDDDNDNGGSNSSAYYHYDGITGGRGGGTMIIGSSGKEISSDPVSVDKMSADSNSTVTAGSFFAGAAGIFATVRKRKKNKKGTPAPVVSNSGAEPEDKSKLRPIQEYVLIDPEFSESVLCSKLSNMYIHFQNAWQNKNIKELRPYLTDEFYERIDRQLESYRKNGQTNMVERIAVLGVTLSGFTQQQDYDVFKARVKTRIVDYVVDDKTGSVVRGSKTAEKFMEYEWTLIRKSGVKTVSESGTRTITCPSCGAPLEINKSAKCEYCGSIISADSSDWAVVDMKGLSQLTK